MNTVMFMYRLLLKSLVLDASMLSSVHSRRDFAVELLKHSYASTHLQCELVNVSAVLESKSGVGVSE